MNLFNQYFDALQSPPIFITLIFIWSIIWKGLALWRASKNNQLNWFIALLLLNTAGILDIVYLFYFAKEKMTIEELKNWFKNKLHR